jgi:4-hydroxy-tetrahydrodipicolinate synthase
LPKDKPVKIWVADESRFGLHTQSQRCWALRGQRVVIPQQQRYEWEYVYGALEVLEGGAQFCFNEKVEILKTLVAALDGRVPVVAGIASLSTMEAVDLARAAESIGCSGLMVLPPYVYSSDGREMKSHLQPVIRATNLSCMLYNNPVSYKTNFLPDQIAELAEQHANLHAVKESSADVRRVTALKALCGDRLTLSVGVDDLFVEGMRAGASGWIAGLVNAFPRESVALYRIRPSNTD